MKIIIATIASLAFAGSALAAVPVARFEKIATTNSSGTIELAGGVQFGGGSSPKNTRPDRQKSYRNC